MFTKVLTLVVFKTCPWEGGKYALFTCEKNRILPLERNVYYLSGCCFLPVMESEMSAVYLVALSQVRGSVYSKKDFGEAAAGAFQNLYDSGSVMYWAACEESHRDGGVQYHASIKLSRPQRSYRARAYLDEQHGMKVSFAARQGGYF